MDNIENLKRLFDMCKVTKGNTVNFYNNKIMTLDSNISPIYSISVIYTDTQLNLKENMCIKMEIFKQYLSEGLYEGYIPLQSPKGIKESYILDSFIEPNESQIIYYNNDLKALDNFNTVLAKKAKEGIDIIYIDKYPISICSGILPINKSDKVQLVLYNDNIPGSFLAKFIIDKKKFIINKYIRYLYL